MWHHICLILDTNCLKKIRNIFIISIHGLVYFHQNTKQVLKEFPKTKDARTLKHHQQFFLECIVLIIIDDIYVKIISITCICRRLIILRPVQEYFLACPTRSDVIHVIRPDCWVRSEVWGVEPNTSLGYKVAEPPHHHHIIAGMQDCIPT